jgi:ParB-like chromosome segregation protein Spo0J
MIMNIYVITYETPIVNKRNTMRQELEYKIDRHPLSAAFPDMSREEYSELLDSVREIGIQNPIVLFEDKIIDGWHRYRASVELDIECPAIDLSEEINPVLFVIAQNVSRRSLSASQRALAIVTVNAWRRSGMKNKGALQEPPTKSNEELSDLSKTSKATIKRAKQVISDAVTEVIEAVQSGEIVIVKASEIAKLDKDKQVAALTKPVKKTVPKEVVPDYDPSDDLRETISVLNEELEKVSRAAALGVLEEGMESAQEIMERQAEEIKHLKIENDGLKSMRNTLQVEIKELKKQCSYYQKKMKEIEK